MAHMIMANDKGFVLGKTWHKLPQYVELEVPPTEDQALEVLNYNLEKRQNFITLKGEQVPNLKSFGIVRTDTEDLLVPHVGEDYAVINNAVFFNTVNEFLLYPNKGKIHLESVGTLCNGQTAFVNIALQAFQIKGDDSETTTRIAYYNPLGVGSYKTFVHSTRIVCMNTLRMAEAQGAANKTLSKISHTKSAVGRIKQIVVDLADLYIGIEEHKEKLSAMSAMEMKQIEIDNFARQLYGFDGKEGKAETRFKNNYDQLLTVFNSQDGFQDSIKNTRYAMLQAVTNIADHEDLRKGNDEAFRLWDGLVGNSAKWKDEALKLLDPENDLVSMVA